MPHIIIEYSANLSGEGMPDAVVAAAHDAAIASGLFQLGAIRTRAYPADIHRTADNHPDNAFVHVTARIAAGRTLDQRKQFGQQVSDAILAALEPAFQAQRLAFSLEVKELDPVLSFRRNDILARLEAK